MPRMTEGELTTMLARNPDLRVQGPTSHTTVVRVHSPGPAPTEHDEQAALIAWARANEERLPALQWLYAIPNGGYRHPQTAARLAQEGVQSGVPDLALPVPCRGYGGLYIELKRRRGGQVSNEQRRWLAGLSENGYATAVCHGCEAAIEAIETYLAGAPAAQDSENGAQDGK